MIVDNTEEEFKQLEKQFAHSNIKNVSEAEQDARSLWFSFNQEESLLGWK
jgi:hypothetical protein